MFWVCGDARRGHGLRLEDPGDPGSPSHCQRREGSGGDRPAQHRDTCGRGGRASRGTRGRRGGACGRRAHQKAVVTCEGAIDTGSSDTPAGTWLTDGTRVWIASEGDLPDQLTFPAEPAAKTWQLGEGEEVEVVYAIAAGKDAGAWCFSATYQMGDGGSSVACFAPDKGLYRFESEGGSAAQDITTTIVLK